MGRVGPSSDAQLGPAGGCGVFPVVRPSRGHFGCSGPAGGGFGVAATCSAPPAARGVALAGWWLGGFSTACRSSVCFWSGSGQAKRAPLTQGHSKGSRCGSWKEISCPLLLGEI